MNDAAASNGISLSIIDMKPCTITGQQFLLLSYTHLAISTFYSHVCAETCRLDFIQNPELDFCPDKLIHICNSLCFLPCLELSVYFSYYFNYFLLHSEPGDPHLCLIFVLFLLLHYYWSSVRFYKLVDYKLKKKKLVLFEFKTKLCPVSFSKRLVPWFCGLVYWTS